MGWMQDHNRDKKENGWKIITFETNKKLCFSVKPNPELNVLIT